MEQTPAQSNSPAPSSQCQVPFVTRVGTGLLFLAVLVFLGPPPGGDVHGAPAGSGCGAGRRRERCHRCCTVLLWGKLISLFHYLPISHRKKKSAADSFPTVALPKRSGLERAQTQEKIRFILGAPRKQCQRQLPGPGPDLIGANEGSGKPLPLINISLSELLRSSQGVAGRLFLVLNSCACTWKTPLDVDGGFAWAQNEEPTSSP